MKQQLLDQEKLTAISVQPNLESHDSVISNYVREPLVAESIGRSMVRTQVAAALLALCGGNYVTSGSVFTTPLEWLGRQVGPGSSEANVSLWMGLIIGILCIVYCSLGSLKQRFAAVLYYLLWFIALGTLFLNSSAYRGGGFSKANLGPGFFWSCFFGVFTSAIVILPSLLIIGGAISTFKKIRQRRSESL